MNHHVKKVLDSLPRAIHHDYVFTYMGKPIGLKIRNAFKGACERAGIAYGTKVKGGLRFHDIRATFKTNLLRAGIDKENIDRRRITFKEIQDKFISNFQNTFCDL